MITAINFVNTATLKNQTNKLIHQVSSSGKTLIITQYGHPTVAIVPITEDDFQIKENVKFLQAAKQGLKDIKTGKTTSLKSLVKSLNRKNTR